MTLQHLPEDPLPPAVAVLPLRRQLPRELHEVVVEPRHARLETHRHGRAVDLHADVVRQVRQQVHELHALDGIAPWRLDAVRRERGRGLAWLKLIEIVAQCRPRALARYLRHGVS